VSKNGTCSLAASLMLRSKQTATFISRDRKQPGTVSAEIPVGPKWCEVRQTVFGWTTQNFPFGVKTAHALKISGQHLITVTGKAFYDIAHAPADHSNRRRTPKDYAVWEIHPVMKMEVIQ
jgi:hypothetical protein